MSKKKLISLIIPCYNEEPSLRILYGELCSVSGNMSSYDFEMLFVDDGSRDGTLKILKELTDQDKRVKYISFSRNFGKEAAMYAGLCNVRGDFAAVMDADMQDPPSLLPEMVKILETGEYDSVATRRVTREGEPPIRSLFARMFYRLINRIADIEIVDGARDFRLMRRDMVDAIVKMEENNRFSKGIYGWVGFRTYWLPFKNVERTAGETKWSFWKLLLYSLDGIVNFSQAPLSVASVGGVALTLLSFVLVAFVAARRLFFGDPVVGWASLVCIVMFIGGIELFCTGIVGQYLAKTYLEVKHRPHYIIADTNADSAKRVL